jgi:hypothetical protein
LTIIEEVFVADQKSEELRKVDNYELEEIDLRSTNRRSGSNEEAADLISTRSFAS